MIVSKSVVSVPVSYVHRVTFGITFTVDEHDFLKVTSRLNDIWKFFEFNETSLWLSL